MQTVDEKSETIHLYVVREEEPKPQLLPIFLSVIALAILVVISLFPYQQSEVRAVIRIPAALLPLKTFTATTAVIPTGIKSYPATTAHGFLTITNGSVISLTIPQGFTLDGIVTDTAVFVPAGSANGYGYAIVAAHAQTSGKTGNIPAYAINQVEGASVYIRNLRAFSGGRNSYSVKFVTTQDRQLALMKSRNLLTSSVLGLHYPCFEQVSGAVTVTWRCQFVTYSLPPYMHVTGVKIQKKNLIIAVTFVARPTRTWVK